MNFIPKVTLLAVSISLLTACSVSDSDLTADKSPRPVKVMTLKQPQHTIDISFPAHLEPIQQAKLAFRVPGTITDILVKEGQNINKGDLIAQLDPHDFNVVVTEWQARYAEAMALLAQAKSEQSRVLAASSHDALARVDLDRANTAVTRAKAGVKVAEQRVRAAQDALRYSKLKAPYDGIIASLNKEAYEQAMPGFSIAEIYGQQGYQVSFDVPETIAKQMKPGLTGFVRFNQEKDTHYPVSISEVAQASSLLAKTYRITASLQKTPAYAWPDLTTEITLQMSSASEAGYSLPANAVGGKNSGSWVMRVKDGRAQKQDIDIIGFDGELIRIEGDLKPGDTVITGGTSFVQDGQEVGELLHDLPAAVR